MQQILKYLAFLLPITLIGQNLTLSNKAQVSVITVDQGKNLYDTFGHSAIRILDKENHLDRVYNYGTYDFNTPNFYTKFAQGKLLYEMSSYPFYYFVRNYQKENRTITEEVLDLSTLEKQHFYNFLENNAKPENKKYLYDFFYDNCATRIRDVTTNVLGKENLDFKDELLQQHKTYRDLIHQKLDMHPWGKFGIDLALGSVIDKEAKPKEYCFLPEYIQKNFVHAVRIKAEIPLVKKTRIIFQKREEQKQTTIFKPFLVFTIIAFLVLLVTLKDFKRKKRTKIVDFLLLFITGILGLLIFLLWFATDHTATKGNFNVLWAFLPNLFVAFTIFKQKKWQQYYFMFLLFLLLILLILWIFKIQVFHFALLPILFMLFIRYSFNIWNMSKSNISLKS